MIKIVTNPAQIAPSVRASYSVTFLENEFSNPVRIEDLVNDYNDELIHSVYIQNGPEEDWSSINIYDLLETVIPENQHCHRWGIHIYRFDDFYVVANPDKDIVEVFRD